MQKSVVLQLQEADCSLNRAFDTKEIFMGFISYEESIRALDDLEISPTGYENLFLSESKGRVLAKDIVASQNSPSAPTSAMDGYAIRFEDQALGRLKIDSFDNPAGHDLEVAVTAGSCIKTFTGALMPQGTDTLIPIENVTVEAGELIINEKVPSGFAVRPIGESYSQGEVLLAEGTTIEYAEIGVMAGIGMAMVPVRIKPKVAILATGSEILDLGECSDNPAQIRSSNNYTLQALVEHHQGSALQMGVVSDAYEDIKAIMQEALQNSDIVVTTGGVSVGDYDFVKDIIPELGATVVYKGVRIKPGQHVMVAQKENKFIVGLPGFAFSSTVTFMLYVIPLLARLKGQVYAPNIIKATLRGSYKKRTKKHDFVPCNVHLVNGLYEVDFENKKSGSSAILTNMLGSTALMISPEDAGDYQSGDAVDVMLLL